jgi:hypothetical protein
MTIFPRHGSAVSVQVAAALTWTEIAHNPESCNERPLPTETRPMQLEASSPLYLVAQAWLAYLDHRVAAAHEAAIGGGE